MLPALAYALLFLAYYLNRVLRAVRQDIRDIKDIKDIKDMQR